MHVKVSMVVVLDLRCSKLSAAWCVVSRLNQWQEPPEMGMCLLNSALMKQGVNVAGRSMFIEIGCFIIWKIFIVLCIQLAGNTAVQLLSTRSDIECHVAQALLDLAGRCLSYGFLESSKLVLFWQCLGVLGGSCSFVGLKLGLGRG
jgi:hypothetical protein